MRRGGGEKDDDEDDDDEEEVRWNTVKLDQTINPKKRPLPGRKGICFVHVKQEQKDTNRENPGEREGEGGGEDFSLVNQFTMDAKEPFFFSFLVKSGEGRINRPGLVE